MRYWIEVFYDNAVAPRPDSGTSDPNQVKVDFSHQYVEVTDNVTGKSFTITSSNQWDTWCNDEDVKQYMRAQAANDTYDSPANDAPVEVPVDNNASTVAALGKLKLSNVPPNVLFGIGEAMNDGAKKYGRYNWRKTDVTASVFYDKLVRHLLDWYSGEDVATDSKIHHLKHLIADAGIVLDAIDCNVFIDDRDKEGPRATKAWRDKQ